MRIINLKGLHPSKEAEYTCSGNNGERVAAFFDAYAVPDEDRMVPIVFFSGGYLAGYEDIAKHLPEQLEKTGMTEFKYPVVV